MDGSETDAAGGGNSRGRTEPGRSPGSVRPTESTRTTQSPHQSPRTSEPAESTHSPVSSDSLVAVVAAVVEREGRFLVALRPACKRHGGHWEFPGGKVTAGESEADALGRELAEELGIRVRSVGPSLFRERDGKSRFSVRFRRVEIAGEPEAREHDEVRWADPGALLGLRLAPVDARFVREILARD